MKNIILLLITILTLGFAIPQKNTVFLGTVIASKKFKNDIERLGIDFRSDGSVTIQTIVRQDGTFSV